MNITTGARGNGLADIATGGGATHGRLSSFSCWWGGDKSELSTLHLFIAGPSELHRRPRNMRVKRAGSHILPCEGPGFRLDQVPAEVLPRRMPAVRVAEWDIDTVGRAAPV